MHVPTESNSMYKKRLITAMLDEPVFIEIAQPAPKWIPGWSPTLVAAAVGIALLSALGVFLFLYHHDVSASSSAAATTVRNGNGAVRPLTAEHAAVKAPASIDHGATPVEFKLKRSRTYQKIGTIGLRLVRVNTRRRTCDLSMQLSDRRVVQKRLLLNKPLQLKAATSSEPLQVSISGIGRDSVAGALSTLAASSDSAKPSIQ